MAQDMLTEHANSGTDAFLDKPHTPDWKHR